MTPPSSTTRRLDVDYLARVEGEGSMYVKLAGDTIEELRFEIFEPPRFFEAFLRDRRFGEAPDITARICGICPVAYQMSSVHAMEDAAGVAVDGPLRDLRTLLYCGEWIESHGLHVYLLHAPDFLGYESAIHMAQDHKDVVERGLQLKKAGNDVVNLVGGREIHPVNVKVGGFYRLPSRAELDGLLPALRWAREAAAATIDWVAGFDFPDLEPDYLFVSTDHPDEYPFLGDRIRGSNGLDIAVAEWNDHFEELQVPHSTSLHARLRSGEQYHVGPLARYSLNSEKLAPAARAAAAEAGLGPECRNPFRSIVVRSVEILHAIETALGIIDRWDPPPAPAVDVAPRDAEGHGVSEAPRGLLYHRYRVDGEGLIADAQIVPPTSQNQAVIEDDLRRFVLANLELPDDQLTWTLEQAIRNYDPCISCSCHFLNLEIVRG